MAITRNKSSIIGLTILFLFLSKTAATDNSFYDSLNTVSKELNRSVDVFVKSDFRGLQFMTVRYDFIDGQDAKIKYLNNTNILPHIYIGVGLTAKTSRSNAFNRVMASYLCTNTFKYTEQKIITFPDERDRSSRDAGQWKPFEDSLQFQFKTTFILLDLLRYYQIPLIRALDGQPKSCLLLGPGFGLGFLKIKNDTWFPLFKANPFVGFSFKITYNILLHVEYTYNIGGTGILDGEGRGFSDFDFSFNMKTSNISLGIRYLY